MQETCVIKEKFSDDSSQNLGAQQSTENGFQVGNSIICPLFLVPVGFPLLPSAP
jgi:hypothetical protein